MSQTENSPKPNRQEMSVQMVKAQNCGTVLADGAWFNFDPFGRIHFFFYNDFVSPPTNYRLVLENNTMTYPDIPESVPLTNIQRVIGTEVVMTQEMALLFYQTLKANLTAAGKIKE